MITKGIYQLDIQNGKYNLGCVPNIIIGKYIHMINYKSVLDELDNHFMNALEQKEFFQGVYSFYGHTHLLEKFYQRINELKSDETFIPPPDFYKKLTDMLEKMKDVTYIPNYKNPTAKLITDQIEHWLSNDWEPDYDPYNF